MRKNLFLRSTIRRYLSFVLFLLLFGAGSAAFTVRAVGYLSVSDGIEKLTRYYRPIGTLTSADGDVTAGAKLLEQSGYLAVSDRRCGAAGTLEDYYNTDLDGYSNSFLGEDDIGKSEILVWGKLSNKQHAVEISPDYRYSFLVEEVIYGYPDHVYEGRMIHTLSRPPEGGEEASAVMSDELYDTMQTGAVYLVRACYDTEGNVDSDHGVYRLKQVREGDWFLGVEDGKAQLGSLLDGEAERKEANRHSVLLYGTKDMSVMPEVQEISRDLYLAEGRWIDEEDNEGRNPVCVIHSDFAAVRGIAPGDKLTVTLRDLEKTYRGYILEGENWQECRKETIDFEVVGIYGKNYSRNLYTHVTADSNWIYVPRSCIPEGFGIGEEEGKAYASSYSFVLSTPKEKDAFLAEYRGKLEGLGCKVQFVENGWDTFWGAAQPIEWGAFAGLLVFSGVALLLLLLASYLYLWQHRQEFAILRAMGVPRLRAVFWCAEAVLLPGLPGICIGGALSFRYAVSQAEALLAELPETSSGGASPAWMPVFCAVQAAALLLSVTAGAALLSARPVLEILQGGRVKRKHKRRAAGKAGLPAGKKGLTSEAGGASSDGLLRASAVRSPYGETGRPMHAGGGASTARFVRRCICRSALKSILAVFSAAVFLLALGFLHHSIERNEAEIDLLYKNITVECEIVKANSSVSSSGTGGAFIRGQTVDAVLDTGFIESSYLEAGLGSITVYKTYIVEENGVVRTERGEELKEGMALRGISDIQKFLEIQGPEFEIHYMKGDNEGLFEVDYEERASHSTYTIRDLPPVIIPEEFFSMWEIETGECLTCDYFVGESSGRFRVRIAGYYSGAGAGFDTDTLLLPLCGIRLLKGAPMNYAAASFAIDPEKNRELDTFRAETEEIFADPNAGLTEISFLLWDSELRQAVEPLEKNVGLLKTLYPIVMILSVLAAALTSFLLLQTHTKDAAILRVLGTTKGRTRGMFVSEQLLLAAAGACIGVILTAVISGEAMFTVMLLFMGLYLAGTLAGAMTGAVLATKKMPLALLQVRE